MPSAPGDLKDLSELRVPWHRIIWVFFFLEQLGKCALIRAARVSWLDVPYGAVVERIFLKQNASDVPWMLEAFLFALRSSLLYRLRSTLYSSQASSVTFDTKIKGP